MISLSVGSKKMHERLTGLAILGWDLGELEVEEEVRRYVFSLRLCLARRPRVDVTCLLVRQSREHRQV